MFKHGKVDWEDRTRNPNKPLFGFKYCQVVGKLLLGSESFRRNLGGLTSAHRRRGTHQETISPTVLALLVGNAEGARL